MAEDEAVECPLIRTTIDAMKVNQRRSYKKITNLLGPLMYLIYGCFLYDICAVSIFESDLLSYSWKVGLVAIVAWLYVFNVCHFLRAFFAEPVRLPPYYSFASFEFLTSKQRRSIRNPGKKSKTIKETRTRMGGIIYNHYQDYIFFRTYRKPDIVLYCLECEIVVPPRVHHCFRCRRCIYRRESHHWLLGQCLHHRNLKFATNCAVYNIVTFVIVIVFHSHRIVRDLWGEATNLPEATFRSISGLILSLVSEIFLIAWFCFELRSIKHMIPSYRDNNSRVERAFGTFEGRRGATLCETINLNIGRNYWFLPIDATEPEEVIHQTFRKIKPSTRDRAQVSIDLGPNPEQQPFLAGEQAAPGAVQQKSFPERVRDSGLALVRNALGYNDGSAQPLRPVDVNVGASTSQGVAQRQGERRVSEAQRESSIASDVEREWNREHAENLRRLMAPSDTSDDEDSASDRPREADSQL